MGVVVKEVVNDDGIIRPISFLCRGPVVDITLLVHNPLLIDARWYDR